MAGHQSLPGWCRRRGSVTGCPHRDLGRARQLLHDTARPAEVSSLPLATLHQEHSRTQEGRVTRQVMLLMLTILPSEQAL